MPCFLALFSLIQSHARTTYVTLSSLSIFYKTIFHLSLKLNPRVKEERERAPFETRDSCSAAAAFRQALLRARLAALEPTPPQMVMLCSFADNSFSLQGKLRGRCGRNRKKAACESESMGRVEDGESRKSTNAAREYGIGRREGLVVKWPGCSCTGNPLSCTGSAEAESCQCSTADLHNPHDYKLGMYPAVPGFLITCVLGMPSQYA